MSDQVYLFGLCCYNSTVSFLFLPFIMSLPVAVSILQEHISLSSTRKAINPTDLQFKYICFQKCLLPHHYAASLATSNRK